MTTNEDFKPIIDRHCGDHDPQHSDWQILQIHARYVLQLLQALSLAQTGDDIGAQAAITQMLDDINRNELTIQKVMDGNKAKMHWNRRLDRAKCSRVDVM